MPEDQLTVGELGRTVDAMRREFREGIHGLNSRLDKLVSTEVYTLQSAHFDRRLNDFARELQKVADDRDALETAFEQYQLAERDRREKERQARLYQLIVPVLICIVTSAIAIWAVVK